MPKPPIHAAPAYENAVIIAHDQLQRIDELLSNLPHPDLHEVHWGHVGTVNHVNSEMTKIIEALESMAAATTAK